MKDSVGWLRLATQLSERHDPIEIPACRSTGLFPCAPDLSQHPANMLEYVPDPPLWSDGMAKQRFVIC